jgi:uncharacterized membrane protein YozB (DUF420 family)
MAAEGAATSAEASASWVKNLPSVNACFNSLSAVLLTLGYVFIRRKNQQAHRNCMLAALGSSALFLAGYLTYHFTVQGVTRFTEPAWFRPIYLTILLTHTVLAVVIVPLILMTVVRALRERFDRHRAIARWTWPLWMYVSVTGVLIYLLLYQIFPQR